MKVPMTRPNPPRLSEAADALRAIEDRGYFSNFGPVNAAFEQAMIAQMFGGVGACTTVCNATIGLMLAVRQAIGDQTRAARSGRPAFALMPSFTFAAAAQAAIWCGLVPLFCDIDPDNWAASPEDEDRLIAAHGEDIAVVMPYATFGWDIDLARYSALTARTGIPVVVDAASSLGTVSADGRGFGSGFAGSMVFSMHATKSFATGEAGLIYSADAARIRELRAMSNFGFGEPRTATLPGLNGKLSEVAALLGTLRLESYEQVALHRQALAQRYRKELPQLQFQARQTGRQAHQFGSALLPRGLASQRADIVAALAASGIGCGTYFSPHVAQHPYFRRFAEGAALPVTDDVAARIISLPMFDSMDSAQCAQVIDSVAGVLKPRLASMRPARRGPPKDAPCSAAQIANLAPIAAPQGIGAADRVGLAT
jgi:dTDP-4-amino-4,6-dideoxygalactose transaminase